MPPRIRAGSTLRLRNSCQGRAVEGVEMARMMDGWGWTRASRRRSAAASNWCFCAISPIIATTATPAEFDKLIRDDYEKWRGVVKSSGVQVD